MCTYHRGQIAVDRQNEFTTLSPFLHQHLLFPQPAGAVNTVLGVNTMPGQQQIVIVVERSSDDWCHVQAVVPRGSVNRSSVSDLQSIQHRASGQAKTTNSLSMVGLTSVFPTSC